MIAKIGLPCGIVIARIVMHGLVDAAMMPAVALLVAREAEAGEAEGTIAGLLRDPACNALRAEGADLADVETGDAPLDHGWFSSATRRPRTPGR
ncbi:hypothetical protein [Sphingomonas koreensis]